METIVVGVDESKGAAAALEWAVAEAQLRSCRLRVVMCWGYLDQHHGPGDPTTFDPSYGEQSASLALEKILAPMITGKDVAVEPRVVNDLAARGLLQSSADAGLLVVGARGGGGFEALLLGSVSDHCLHHSTVPVAVVRPFDPSHDRSEERQQRIVVGIDASEPSQRALQWAVEEARLRHASLSAVHAWPLPALVVPFVADMPGLEQAAKELLERALEPIDDSDLDQPIARRLTGGAPAPVLLGAAQAADLVVVGSRGRGGFKELLLGSVSHRLATHARCPVVVIPHHDGQVAEAT
jgi:nucleotide-binding universal stress UspA family protein